MATRGRKPRSPEQKKAAGERADRLNHAAPTSPPGVPGPPEVLDDEGRAQWLRMAPLLTSMGVLRQSDADALALYCDHYSTWVRATAAIRSGGDAGGLVTTCGTGGLKVNPLVSVARESMAAMQRLLVEFGCTPSSRSRVRVEGQTKDELDNF